MAILNFQVPSTNAIINHLLEKVDTYSTSDMAASWDDSYAKLVFVVTYDFVLTLTTPQSDGLSTIISAILGGAYLGGSQQLIRWNQMRHPRYRWLAARKIESVVGLSARGNVAVPQQPNVSGVQNLTAKYNAWRITVIFDNPLYNLVDDIDPRLTTNYSSLAPPATNGLGFQRGSNEWLRNFYLESVDETTNFITIEGGSARFLDPALLANPRLKDFNNSSFQSPGRSVAEVKQLYKFTWTYIPENYCATGQAIPAARIRTPIFGRYLNYVNSQTFLGFPPFTLLFEPFGYIRKRMPISTTNDQPLFWVELTLCLRYFNPPTQQSTATISINGVDVPVGGHLTAPLSYNNGYYQIVRFDTNTNSYAGPIYKYCNFYQIFTSEQTQRNAGILI